MIRSAYTRPCRFFTDSPDTVTIKWFFCDPAASNLPFPTAFCSSNWDTEQDWNSDIGEVPMTTPNWNAGETPPTASGIKACGRPDFFLNGFPRGTFSHVLYDVFSIPICCSVPVHGDHQAIGLTSSFPAKTYLGLTSHSVPSGPLGLMAVLSAAAQIGLTSTPIPSDSIGLLSDKIPSAQLGLTTLTSAAQGLGLVAVLSAAQQLGLTALLPANASLGLTSGVPSSTSSSGGGGGGGTNIDWFNGAGAHIWTAPITGNVTVRIWATGGNGGGGGGAYSESVLAVVNGTEYALFISTPELQQGSWFSDPSLAYADCGKVGPNGMGGQASSCIGDITRSGGNGSLLAGGGGAGGVGGTDGGNASWVTGGTGGGGTGGGFDGLGGGGSGGGELQAGNPEGGGGGSDAFGSQFQGQQGGVAIWW